MKHILGRASLPVLARFAASHTLLAFDFDGTLAPIVTEPGTARMRPSTRRRFVAVCERFPTAVISGRERADVAARLGSAPVRYVVGNHGLESAAGALAPPGTAVTAMCARMTAALRGQPGIEVEDKRYSFTIHYRRAEARRDARASILREIARLPGRPRLVPGKLAINVLPGNGPNKGTALRALCAREGSETAIFVGDDATDEDAFSLDRSQELLGIRVRDRRASAARYFLRDQREIDVLLDRLIVFRQ